MSKKKISYEIKNIKTEDIKSLGFLTTPINIDSTKFEGNDFDLIFGFLYIIKKYPEACLAILPKINSTFPDYEIGIEWICVNKKRRLIIPSDFEPNFKKCLNNKKITFIIMLLTFSNKYGCDKKKYSEHHANMLIYDKANDIMYRFEPNGCIVELDTWFDYKDFDREFEEYIRKTFSIANYKPPKLCCPFLGFQELQVNENLEKTIDPNGFCAAWSLFVIDLVLRNPKKDLKNLQLLALKKFHKDKKELTTFIRNFSEFVVKKRSNIFKKISKTTMKKLETSNTTIEHIPQKDIKKINNLIMKEFKVASYA